MSTERPILFSAPMVRVLLDGSKTQTRRSLKRQPWASCSIEEGHAGESPFVYSALHGAGPGHEVEESRSPCRCPYGQPGDRLWVRESTHRRPMLNLLTGEPLAPEYDGGAYTADDVDVLTPDGFDLAWWYSRKSCPPIHMPRWASRILLEITGVRVERLNDCSEADARDEGAPGGHGAIPGCQYSATPLEHYRHVWEDINGAGSWDANPWVWVIEFKRVTS